MSIAACQQQQPFNSRHSNGYGRHGNGGQRFRDEDEEPQQDAVVRKLSLLSVYMQQHGSHSSVNALRANHDGLNIYDNKGNRDNSICHGKLRNDGRQLEYDGGNSLSKQDVYTSFIYQGDNNIGDGYNGCHGSNGCNLPSLGALSTTINNVTSQTRASPLQLDTCRNNTGSFAFSSFEMLPDSSASERSSSPSLDSSVRNRTVSENGTQGPSFFSPSSSAPDLEWRPSSVPTTFGNAWTYGPSAQETRIQQSSRSMSSRNDNERREQLSGSGADSPRTPKQSNRAFAAEFTSMGTNSSSLSFSGSREDHSGASDDGNRDNSGDMEAESSCRSLKKIGGGLKKKSLSSHFNGKSRSFTSLADVSSIQSIQDLAKPENPYFKKRRSLHNNLLLERHRSFPLRSVDGTIHKKTTTKGGSNLAVALAMSGGIDFMETLTEDVTEGTNPSMKDKDKDQDADRYQGQDQEVPSGGLTGKVKGVSGIALQESWRKVWENGASTTRQKSTLSRRFYSKPDLSQMVD